MLGLILRVLGGVVLGGAAVAAVCISVSKFKEQMREKYKNAVSLKIKDKINKGDYNVIKVGLYDENNYNFIDDTLDDREWDDELKQKEVGDIIDLY